VEKLEREMMRPVEISGRENVGAEVPSGSMVEDTDIEIGMSAVRGGCEPQRKAVKFLLRGAL
jgi:hypothetical protein